jgi:hypothetical protein
MPLFPLAPNLPSAPGADPTTPQPVMGDDATLRPPVDWSPRPEKMPAFPDAGARDPATSFPTPFYRMEATKAAIERDGELFAIWSQAVLALAGGLFEVKIASVAGLGAFGACLARLDAHRRHLPLLSATVGGRRQVMAVGDPETLVWPHVRRTAAEWNELQPLIANRDRYARAVLADLRAIVQAANEWSSAIPWMRGLDRLLDAPASSDGRAYHDARGEGPFTLMLGGQGEPKPVPVYFPVFDRDGAALVRRFANLTYTASAGFVTGVDANRVAQIRIASPSVADPVAAGLGVWSRVGNTPPEWPAVDQLTLDEPAGLFKALPALYPSGRYALTDLVRTPYRFADPVRVLARAIGSAGVPTHAIAGQAPGTYGRSAIVHALTSGQPLPDAEYLAKTPGAGFVLRRDGETPVLWVESSDVDGPADLRGLGYALWMYFTGAANEIRGGPETSIGAPDGRLAWWRGNRIESEAVPEGARALAHKRLATLQRFARAWDLAGPAPASGKTARDLFRAAAAAWVRFCTGRDPFPNGPASRVRADWSLEPLREKVPMPADSVGGAA